MSTPNLAITHMATSQSQKEVTFNAAIDALDAALAGYTALALADANLTLTSSQALGAIHFRFTGALTAARNVIVPINTKLYAVRNLTTGGFAITVKTPAGAGVTIPNGAVYIVACNGTDVVLISTGGNALQLQGKAIDTTAPADGQALVYDATGAKWKPGAGGSGGSVALQTNGVANGSQSQLNLVAGSGVTLADDGTGDVTLTAAGGGGGGSVLMNDMITSPPALSGWTWVNQGTATAVQTKGKAILMTIPDAGATLNWRALCRAAPSTPYKVRAMFRSWNPNTNSSDGGICFRDSVSGKMLVLETLIQNAVAEIVVDRLTDAMTWTSRMSVGPNWNFVAGAGGLPSIVAVWQLRNDGATLYLDWSLDGENFINVYSEAVGSFLTPDQIGFEGICAVGTAGVNVYQSLISWQVDSNATL